MTTQIIEKIHAQLATVSDPELHRPLPDLGMIESVDFNEGKASVTILLTISGCPMRDRLRPRLNLSKKLQKLFLSLV